MKKRLKKIERALWIMFILAVIGSAYYLFNEVGNNQQPASTSTTQTKVTDVVKDSGDISVYFCPHDDCEGLLSDFISTGQASAHCAFFELNLPKVKEQLQKRKDAGVDVRVVVDGDYKDEADSLDFVHFENRSNFMHNKFCIIDGKKVSTGSMNPTENCAYRNNNNLLLINSEKLAENYEAEFDELWNYQFGKGAETKNPVIYVGDIKVENYFCPDDCKENSNIKAIEKVNSVLRAAKSNIYFMTFSFTHESIANSLLLKMKEGVNVKGIFENRNAGSEYSKDNVLSYQGASVIMDKNPAVMHHKVFIVDNETVITGSFNPSNNGQNYNDENILIIHDKGISQKYIEEFDYVWNLK